MHPFFDAKSLSDDELIKKYNELSGRLHYARAMVGDPYMLEQMELILDSIYQEQQERMFKTTWDTWQSRFPEVINSDPEFKKDRKADQQRAAAQKNARPENKFKKLAPIAFHEEENPAKADTKKPDKSEGTK